MGWIVGSVILGKLHKECKFSKSDLCCPVKNKINQPTSIRIWGASRTGYSALLCDGSEQELWNLERTCFCPRKGLSCLQKWLPGMWCFSTCSALKLSLNNFFWLCSVICRLSSSKHFLHLNWWEIGVNLLFPNYQTLLSISWPEFWRPQWQSRWYKKSATSPSPSGHPWQSQCVWGLNTSSGHLVLQSSSFFQSGGLTKDHRRTGPERWWDTTSLSGSPCLPLVYSFSNWTPAVNLEQCSAWGTVMKTFACLELKINWKDQKYARKCCKEKHGLLWKEGGQNLVWRIRKTSHKNSHISCWSLKDKQELARWLSSHPEVSSPCISHAPEDMPVSMPHPSFPFQGNIAFPHVTPRPLSTMKK